MNAETVGWVFGGVVALFGFVTIWLATSLRHRRFIKANETAKATVESATEVVVASMAPMNTEQAEEARKVAKEAADGFRELLEQMPADDRFPTVVVTLGALAVIFGAALAGLVELSVGGI